jgi:hypothetical protein
VVDVLNLSRLISSLESAQRAGRLALGEEDNHGLRKDLWQVANEIFGIDELPEITSMVPTLNSGDMVLVDRQDTR